MFSHWVALDKTEFKQLRDLLENLCDHMGKQDARNPVMKGLQEFAQLYSNEEFSDLTVAEILGKRLGIPLDPPPVSEGPTPDTVGEVAPCRPPF